MEDIAWRVSGFSKSDDKNIINRVSDSVQNILDSMLIDYSCMIDSTMGKYVVFICVIAFSEKDAVEIKDKICLVSNTLDMRIEEIVREEDEEADSVSGA